MTVLLAGFKHQSLGYRLRLAAEQDLWSLGVPRYLKFKQLLILHQIIDQFQRQVLANTILPADSNQVILGNQQVLRHMLQHVLGALSVVGPQLFSISNGHFQPANGVWTSAMANIPGEDEVFTIRSLPTWPGPALGGDQFV